MVKTKHAIIQAIKLKHIDYSCKIEIKSYNNFQCLPVLALSFSAADCCITEIKIETLIFRVTNNLIDILLY